MPLHLLSPLNQVYRNLAMLVSANSCEWIVLDGPLDLDRLRAAAVATVQRHPVLNSVQVLRFPFYAWKELDTPVEVDIRHELLGPAPDDAALHAKLVANIHGEALPITRSRPWRLHVTEHPDGRTWLQIITTHVFTDGRSANVVTRDLGAAYSALASGRTLPARPPASVERDPFRLFTARLTLAQRWRLGWRGLAAIVRDATARCTALVLPDRPRGDTRVRLHDYGGTAWHALHQGARGAGLSVHPLIIAAVLRVMQSLNARVGHASPVIRLIDNFSLRRFAEPAGSVADLYDVFAVPYTIDFEMDDDTRALVLQVRRKLDDLKAGGILTELYRNWHYRNAALLSDKKLGTRLVLRHVMRSNVICTNIGPVPEEFTHFGPRTVLDYYSFSQMFPPGRLMFLFSTWRGHLRLVLLHDGNTIPDELAREIGEVLLPQALAQVVERLRDPPSGTASKVPDALTRRHHEAAPTA